MNKYTSLIILIAVFLMSGCMERQVERYSCDSFTTPWSDSAYIREGAIRWQETKYSDYRYYKIPDGDICRRETWDIKNNDLHLFSERSEELE